MSGPAGTSLVSLIIVGSPIMSNQPGIVHNTREHLQDRSAKHLFTPAVIVVVIIDLRSALQQHAHWPFGRFSLANPFLWPIQPP